MYYLTDMILGVNSKLTGISSANLDVGYEKYLVRKKLKVFMR
jgi:hypothetical protein